MKTIVEQLLLVNAQANKEGAFRIFMEKMEVAEKSVQEQGYFGEEVVEAELVKI